MAQGVRESQALGQPPGVAAASRSTAAEQTRTEAEEAHGGEELPAPELLLQRVEESAELLACC